MDYTPQARVTKWKQMNCTASDLSLCASRTQATERKENPQNGRKHWRSARPTGAKRPGPSRTPTAQHPADQRPGEHCAGGVSRHRSQGVRNGKEPVKDVRGRQASTAAKHRLASLGRLLSGNRKSQALRRVWSSRSQHTADGDVKCCGRCVTQRRAASKTKHRSTTGSSHSTSECAPRSLKEVPIHPCSQKHVQKVGAARRPLTDEHIKNTLPPHAVGRLHTGGGGHRDTCCNMDAH